MKKELLVKRIFSIMIALALLVSAVPISLAVQNLLVEETTSKIVREVTELREESVKHFLCEDGSYIAATYSAPVHYKENGEWKEIDNSLSLDRTTLSESGKPTYTTKSGGLDVSIPQDFSDEQKITAKNKGYEISFGLNADQDNVSLKKSASIVDVEALSSKTEVKNIDVNQNAKVLAAKNLSANDVVEKHNKEMMAADNQSSAVTFNNVFPNTDLEYIVSSTSIKENIVVYEPQNEYTYSFNMDFEGLIPVTHTDGSISLVEPSDPDDFVFWIEAPYMYDANNEESIDIEMTLEKNGDKYLLTLVASEEWINNENRVFPVVIDPTISLSDSCINDVFVIDGLYAGSPRVKNELRVGKNLTNITRTYIKLTMPTNIPNNSEVSSGYLRLHKDYYFQALGAENVSVVAYDCCNVATWKTHEVSWNNQPFNNSENGYKTTSGAILLDSIPASKNRGLYQFNITEAVQRWVNGGINNGLMLASSNESTKTQLDFHSSRVTDSSSHPDAWFTYSVPTVSQSTWYTDSQANSSSVITVNSTQNWVAISNQSWLTISNKTNSTFKMNVTNNPGVHDRVGTITISSGNGNIGTVTVTQSGVESFVSADIESLNVGYKTDSKTINISSNTDWIITTPDWIVATPSTGSGNKSVTITAVENCENSARNGLINIITGDKTTQVRIKQLDKLSNYFNYIDSDNKIKQRDSTEYYHPLATWSMELSNYAYNPIIDAGQIVPGIFMNTERTAEEELISYGFAVQSYNYGNHDYAAHIIAHKTITCEDGVERPLVVVVARGSESFEDWLVNISTQIDVLGFDDFEAGSNSVIQSLYTGPNSENTCGECLGVGCVLCKGYIPFNEVENPIILVAGHSLGAAIANLTAYHLNTCDNTGEHCQNAEQHGKDDIFCYTFGTPNVAKGSLSDTEASKSNNIFNILNNNDIVTFVPSSFDITKWNDLGWYRYGRDFCFTMPLNISWLPVLDIDLAGIAGHIMGVYLSWMNNLSTKLYMPSEEIKTVDLESLSTRHLAIGILPKIVKFKCPVSVTLNNSSGNTVAFESQNEDDVVHTQAVGNDIGYSDGVISWITDNNEKVFFIPYGYDDINAHIESYDYGTMKFTIETVGVVEPLSSKTFNDVSVNPGKEFLVEVLKDVLPEDTQLFVIENGEIVEEITDTNPFFKSVTVNSTEVAYGESVTFTLVTDNTVSAMMLHNVNAAEHINLVPGEGEFNVEVSGENELTWTVTNYTDTMNIGENVYDISVQSDGVWCFYENVVAVSVTES